MANMAYTDEKFPEFAEARRHDGTCRICECKRDESHDVRRHEAWESANDATW